MPTRVDLPYNSVSRDAENGGRWKGGNSGEIVVGDRPGSIASNALLLYADLVDTFGVAVDGTATTVDNVTLVGDEIVLRASDIGATGGHIDNGLWRVPADPTDPWTRHRTDLHQDGLTVVIRDGTAKARGTSSPLVDFGGMQETHWILTTRSPVLDTDKVEFRQLPTHDGMKITYGGGTLVIPAAGTLIVPFDGIGNGGAFGTDLNGLYYTLVTGIGANLTAEYSAHYYVDVSIYGSRTSGAGPIAAEIHVGPTAGAVALYQEVIHHNMTTTDERFHGGSLVRLAGEDLERIEIHLSDPAGVGFTYTCNEIYMDIITVARR